MFYVYLIKSISHPEQKYIGQTDDLKKRLTQHSEIKFSGIKIGTANNKVLTVTNNGVYTRLSGFVPDK